MMCSSERFRDVSDIQGALKKGNLECSSALNMQRTAIILSQFERPGF